MTIRAKIILAHGTSSDGHRVEVDNRGERLSLLVNGQHYTLSPHDREDVFDVLDGLTSQAASQTAELSPKNADDLLDIVKDRSLPRVDQRPRTANRTIC